MAGPNFRTFKQTTELETLVVGGWSVTQAETLLYTYKKEKKKKKKKKVIEMIKNKINLIHGS